MPGINCLMVLVFNGVKYILASLAMGVFISFLIASVARERPAIRKTVGENCEYVSSRTGVGAYKLSLPKSECRLVKLRMDFVLSMLLDYPDMKVANEVGARSKRFELYMYHLRPESRLSAIAMPRSVQRGLLPSAGVNGEAARTQLLEGADNKLLLVVHLGDLRKVYRVYGELQVVYVFHETQGSVEVVDSRVLEFLHSAVNNNGEGGTL